MLWKFPLWVTWSSKLRVDFMLCLMTYKTHEKQPFYLHFKLFTFLLSSLPRLSRGITLLVPRVKTNTGAMAVYACVPSRLNRPLPSLRFCNLWGTSQDALWLGLSPTDTTKLNCTLMCRNCFVNFAVEHWFDCAATEPDLTDWWLWFLSRHGKPLQYWSLQSTSQLK